MPRPGLLLCLLERQQLLLPSHEAGEPPCCTGLQTPPDRTGPDQLKDLDGLRQPLDRKLPQSIDLDQPFGESEGRGRQPNTAWGGELFHTRRQVGGLAHGGVVHMQIIANRPHHHFARVEAHTDLHL
jgi:hypothetical protein